MKIVIGGDHAGFALKNEVAALMRSEGYEVTDLGAHTYDAGDDYPDFALSVARAIAAGEAERGVVICGSGIGASVAANKVKGVRAGLCHDTYSAHQGVEHDQMNILCLGSRIVGSALAAEIVTAFLRARYSGEARHARRLEKVVAAEETFGQ